MQEVGAALAALGHDVTFLSAAWEPGVSELDGVRTVRLKRHREEDIGHEADFGRRVLPRLMLGRYDVVHSMGRRDAVASIRASRIHPHRRTIFTDLGYPSRAWWGPQGREGAVVEQVVAGIDVYSCMSEWALEWLERDYGRADGIVVPGGVDLKKMVPAPARTVEPTLLYSGSLVERRKGVDTLLEALPIVAETEPEVQLWLSGPGDPGQLLDRASPSAKARTTVLGTGSTDEQHERYGRAWATCLPSIGDSFGMVLVESLACGTPLVVTTHGAPQELVDPGANGEICEPGDVEGLARACCRAIELARRPDTAAICRRRAEPFDWRTGLAPRLEAIYARRD